jgi:TPR repeat protein
MSEIDQAIQAYQAKDYTRARELCAKLAEEGHAHARYMLGMMHSFGEGGPSDPAAAARHYRLAADAGHTVAQYCLAALHAQGRGVPQDYAEAMRWYRKAAEGGDPDALFKIGVMFANAEGVEKDMAEAERWWRQAADKGHHPAMLFLGHLYGGLNHEAVPGEAAAWYLKAWQAGSKEAATSLLRMTPALEQTADAGSAQAQTALGVLHKFVHKNHPEAVRRLTQAAGQDHPEALRLLGHSYQYGQGVDQDLARAAGLYQRAAERGDKYGQLNLAVFYERGLGGLARDVNQAIKWYRRAANQGMFEANHPLADLLARRNRDRADANEAVQRLMMVAVRGPEDAEYRLVSGDGSWSMTTTKRGTITALHGITMDELKGLPEED